MNKYGFIGGGNMGGAMALSCARAVGADRVLLVDRDEETTARLAQNLGVCASSYDEIAKECRLIFVGAAGRSCRGQDRRGNGCHGLRSRICLSVRRGAG